MLKMIAAAGMAVLSVSAYAQDAGGAKDSLKSVVITDEVIVSATRVTEKSAVAFSVIDKLTLRKQNFGQDLPMILNWTPSIVTTSDAGAGIGYTGMRIRGSDGTRINVTINGIPYNDAESQGTFWVDVPDIATSTNNIQIQRGVGTSTNGAAAFGASINLQTNTRNDKPYADVLNSFGSFGTHRHTVGVGSGLINNRFIFDGRLSMIKSDGYIDRGSSNLKSYYLSGGYYGNKTIVKAIAFGGQEITYQSWNGVPESKLKNDRSEMDVTAVDLLFNGEQTNNLLKSNSRTFNMFLYPNQVDNYKQDNYQLHFSHRFNPNFTANVSGHMTYGRGYYEEYKYNQEFGAYGLPNVVINGTEIDTTSLVRQRWLKNYFYGGTFSLTYENGPLSSILGGGINRYDGDHYGNIMWTYVNAGVPINYQYYLNNGVKDDGNIYLKNTYAFNEKLSGFVDLQYRYVGHKMKGLESEQNTFDIHKKFHFFNPKLGLTWTVNDFHKLYASYSSANREPTRDDFVNAPTGVDPKHEHLDDFEAGWRYNGSRGFTFNANYYFMNYKNQLVLTGALNDVGASLRTNVPDSYRTGIELETMSRLSPKFTIGANLTVSRNKIRNFTEVLYDYAEPPESSVIENHYKNTDISFSPNVIVGGIFSYNIIKGFEASVLTKFVSRQYLDNTSHDDRSIDAYYTADLRLIYTMHPKGMREISVSFLANNFFSPLNALSILGKQDGGVFDGVKYASNGYTYGYFYGKDEVRQNYYYPQAQINYMAMVALRF